MIQHPTFKKSVVYLLACFFTVALFVATAATAESPSLTRVRPEIVDSDSGQGPSILLAQSQKEDDGITQEEETEKAEESRSMMLQGPSAEAKDLLQVYLLARKNDPTFQSERYRHEASPETVKQAYSELLPYVSADGYFQYSRQEIFHTDVAVFGEELAKFESKGYGLTLTQPLFRYSSIKRVVQAKEEVKQADFEFEAAIQDLIFRVADAYIGALAAHENLVFTKTQEESIELHFELARQRFDSGLAPVTDFHDAKARLATTTARRIRVENNLDDAMEALEEITGQKIDNLFKLKYSLINKDVEAIIGSQTEKDQADGSEPSQEGMPLVGPDPDDVDLWIDAARKQNPDVQVRQKAVQVAQREVERQKVANWPTIAFVGTINRDDVGGSLFGGGSDVEKQEAMLQLDFPIYQGGSVFSKTRAARKFYKATEQDLEKELRLVKRETRAAFLGVLSAIENIEALKESVVSNQIGLEAKKEGFKSGLFPSLVVLDAERDLLQAKLEYAKAQYEYILNSLRLKKVVGALSQEDLVGINQWLE